MSSESTTYIDISPYHEILSGMNFILSISVGVVKLTGMAGTGKTRLLGQLQNELRADKQETVMFAVPPKSVKDMHTAITRQFRLNTELPFEQGLARHLIAKSFDQQRLIVIFDAAETLSAETLQGLTLFRKVLHHDQPLVSIVLCGSEALNDRLAEPVCEPLVEDLLLSYELNPLSREQLLVFSKACMATQGLQFDIDTAMLDSLLQQSGGLPGPIPALLLALRAPPPAAIDADIPPTGQTPIAAGPAQPLLSPDELLISSARAEKIRLDERRKLTLKYSAMAASVLAGAFLAWPYISPLLLDNYHSLTGGSQPAPVAPAPQTPVQVEAPAVAIIPEVQSADPAPAVEIPAAPPIDAEPALIAEAPESAEEAAAPEPAIEIAAVASEPSVDEPATAEPALAPTVAEPVAAPAAVPAAAIASTTVPPAPAPAPAPTPTIAPPAAASSAPADGSPASLESVVRAWLTAWQNQDPDTFFMWYHTDFAPLYQSTLAAWRDDRRVKLTRPASIVIGLEDFNVGTRSALGTTVSFRMTYQSPTYADSTLKEVLIGPDLDGQWRILQEFNRDVAVLPSGTRVDPATLIAAAPAPASTAPPTATAIPAAPVANAASPPAVASVASPPPNLPTPAIQSPRASAPTRTVQVDRAAAPLAAAPTVVVPAEARTGQDPEGIGSFLAAWLTAWQNQDLNGYFGAYHPDYKAPTMTSAEAWRDDRTMKITRPAAIVLNMDDLEILESDSRHARVVLVLEYHSTHYADRTEKEIELERGGNGAWIITQERNTRVENLPLVRLLPTDNVATL